MGTRQSDGFLSILGHQQYYRVFEPAVARSTVIGLHGGPGMSHDYLVPLGDLAERGYRVVLFDQLGCGRSEVPADHSMFSLEHHVAETEAVRTSLDLGRVHVVGSSYGGLLAIAYALAHPPALRSLTTVGGLASVPLAQAEMTRLRGELPASVRATLDRGEAAGTTSSSEYQAAAMEFYRRYLCRLDPWPAEVTRSMELGLARPVYGYMNGPSEFVISGTIRDIDLSPRLAEIRVPTLVLGGRYDEVTPLVAEQIRAGIPSARSRTFENSSHLPFWEERSAFIDTLDRFLQSVPA